jgi:hypothetical protein
MSRLLSASLAALLGGGGLTAAAAPVAPSALHASAQSTVEHAARHRIKSRFGYERGAIVAGMLANPCLRGGCYGYYEAGYDGPGWANGYNGGYAGGWGRGGGSYHGGGFHGGLRRGGIAGFHGGIRGGGNHGGGWHGGGFNGGHL